MALRCVVRKSPMLATAATTRWTTRASIAGLGRRLDRTMVAARSFSADTTRRPKPIKVKKSEARRRVEPKPKAANDALVEQQPPSAPVEYSQGGPFQDPYPPQTLGGRMKESFFWGIGMALAFTFVGLIFGRMEETDSPGRFEGSTVSSVEQDEA
ncbi:hypothetical protein PINS_up014506 [Pythium insidiosum]|nr:hypothetical protein PINS_up014506 [Pythium insidiosum]